MPLSRNHRTDRRRRVMLDAIAHDSELAVENVRARKRNRRTSEADEESEYGTTYRDPGYSQAVRRACQQRLVQLIPVRRGSVAVVLTALWIFFGMMLFAHYWIHVRPPVKNSLNLAQLPISRLFDLRSPHGIGHWLTSQLWLLTALASWMIFNLRRHKLDDYRARYRIWVFIAIAAFFSSFDASTSVLLLLGYSIDGWTRAEIGYGGWPLVLASFGSMVGVLGIRLCSELKTVPSSVVSWIVGLLAWAASALLGTGLVRTTWTEGQLGLIVGGLWLGGILAVFQSAAMYLRATYIQAQKRFLQRSGCELNPIRLKVPKVSLGIRGSREQLATESIDADESSERPSRWKMPWKRRADQNEIEEYEEQSDRKQSTKQSMQRESDRESIESNRNAERAKEPTKESARDTGEAKQKGRLFGLIPNRQIRNEIPEFEPVREDDDIEVDMGLTKKRGWFGIGGNKVDESTSLRKTTDQPAAASTTSSRTVSSSADSSDAPTTKTKRSWWPGKKTRSSADEQQPHTKSDTKTRVAASSTDTSGPARKGWLPSLKRSSSKPKTEGSDRPASDSGTKKSMFGLRKTKTQLDSSDAPAKASKPTESTSKEKKEKRNWLGMFDGFKLKPPSTDSSNRSETSSKPTATPTPVKPNSSMPSTNDYEEDDNENDNRPMSKAERKRLRRQQDDRRAA
jgi:hypothetical protein